MDFERFSPEGRWFAVLGGGVVAVALVSHGLSVLEAVNFFVTLALGLFIFAGYVDDIRTSGLYPGVLLLLLGLQGWSLLLTHHVSSRAVLMALAGAGGVGMIFGQGNDGGTSCREGKSN